MASPFCRVRRFPTATPRDLCSKGDCRHVAANIGSGKELHNFYVPAAGDQPNPKINGKFPYKLDFLKEGTAR